ncbi:MAG: hypothetical protein HYX66_09500 [Ignavibacteria bacterium]|nr:hypothetical protein [Ignavibacteria bacterium]
MKWADLLKDWKATAVALITVVAFLVSLFSYTTFLTWVELRPGVSFTDPVHSVVGPVDLTWPIFIVLYTALVVAIFSMLRYPEVLFGTLRAYTILVAFRIICMAMLPLDPPQTMIPLIDPVVQLATGNGNLPLTRDLFFSGHTSILLLVAISAPTRLGKIFFYSLSLFIGIAVILQHVHYTVDVVVAPMAAWLASNLAGTPQLSRSQF